MLDSSVMRFCASSISRQVAEHAPEGLGGPLEALGQPLVDAPADLAELGRELGAQVAGIGSEARLQVAEAPLDRLVQASHTGQDRALLALAQRGELSRDGVTRVVEQAGECPLLLTQLLGEQAPLDPALGRRPADARQCHQPDDDRDRAGQRRDLRPGLRCQPSHRPSRPTPVVESPARF